MLEVEALTVLMLVEGDMAVARFKATDRAEGTSKEASGEGWGETDDMEECRGECREGGGEKMVSESETEEDDEVLCSGILSTWSEMIMERTRSGLVRKDARFVGGVSPSIGSENMDNSASCDSASSRWCGERKPSMMK